MPRNNSVSVIGVTLNAVDANKNRIDEDLHKNEPADFETAINVAGYGKFQFLLFFAIIPVSWSTSINTSSMAIILPSVECDLQITFFEKGVLNAIIFLGMVSSGFLWGYIADVRGRKKVFIYGYLANGICNVFAGFSQNFWTLAVFKYMNGFILSGPYSSTMSYCSEFYGVEKRVRIMLIMGLSITCGNTVVAGLAWLVIPQTWSIVLWDGAFVYNSWRIFLSLCGVPELLGVICLSFFPESPKFLMSQGRTEEALKVFKLVYSLNTGKSPEDYPIRHLEDESRRKALESNEKERSQKTAIFFYPHLPRLILVVVMQFGSMMAMNTIRLWQPQLFTILDNFESGNNATAGRDPSFCEILDFSVARNREISMENSTCVNTVVNDAVYMNSILVSILGSICLLVASFLSNILTHKSILFACYGMTFTCIICMIWSSNMLLTVILTCLFVGLTSVSINMVNGVTTMLFPTSLRTIAVSLAMMSGRIGTIIGNLLFPIFLAYSCLVPVIGLATFLLLCIVLTCFLPLSKNSKK
ncbi:putative transporter SVOPL [Calliopsis andreniformis]|uniref:putative transporter SVOPL n=1 Tax=Calliopsis andreniformis TaxID=337506 RepID=UPI003FCC959A